MVHLRIIVPPDLTERVLRVLEQAAGRMQHRRAARRQRCDRRATCSSATSPARRQASCSRIFRSWASPERGSIAVEQLDVVLSRAAEAAERAAPGDPANAVVWEQVEELASESTTLTASFMIFMVLSTLIAAVGIFLDTPILIIGAMVLGPEFGPLASFCVAVVERRPRLRCARSSRWWPVFRSRSAPPTWPRLIFKWTDLTPDRFSETDHSLAVIISNPDFFSFFVAFIAGVAGVLSLTTAKSGALAGVLISVTTIPAAANIGVAAAYQDWSAARGSTEQLAINLGAICVAGILTLLVQRADLHAPPRRAPAQARARRARRTPIGTLGRDRRWTRRCRMSGEVSERLKERDWKSRGRVIAASRVRIPPSPLPVHARGRPRCPAEGRIRASS